MKKVPLRKCIVSQERLEKQYLIRVVRDKEGNVSIDKTSRANGRGAYLKLDKNIILKAQKRNLLKRHLEVDIPDSIYEELLLLCGDNNE